MGARLGVVCHWVCSGVALLLVALGGGTIIFMVVEKAEVLGGLATGGTIILFAALAYGVGRAIRYVLAGY